MQKLLRGQPYRWCKNEGDPLNQSVLSRMCDVISLWLIGMTYLIISVRKPMIRQAFIPQTNSNNNTQDSERERVYHSYSSRVSKGIHSVCALVFKN